MQPAQLIAVYNLSSHPEGGWYRQTYRSAEQIAADALPGRFSGSRPFSTAIYFLLEQGNFSAFHRIMSDECWHFYAGGPLEIFIIHPEGNLEVVIMGKQAGQHFQYVVPAGCWFASRPDARFVVRQVAAEHERDRLFRAISDPKNAALFSLGAALEAFKDVVIKEDAC